MGSVKSLTVMEEPAPDRLGRGVFHFRDDYSIFDYGKMPDTIPGKGEALCRMGSWNLERVASELGIRTHLRGFREPDRMEVDLVRVLHPGKDDINQETANYLIPLEVIFRNTLPPGSSIFKALDRGELTPQDMGLKEMPGPGLRFEEPFLDFTTKLETSDRRLTPEEARRLAGLTEEEFQGVRDIALRVNGLITRRARELGLEHPDGKIELALGPDRELILVDVLGTPDENRFLFRGLHISKQVLRDYYRRTPWYQEFERALDSLPREQWPVPERLPQELLKAVSGMYRAVSEMWTGRLRWAESLEDAVETIKRFV